VCVKKKKKKKKKKKAYFRGIYLIHLKSNLSNIIYKEVNYIKFKKIYKYIFFPLYLLLNCIIILLFNLYIYNYKYIYFLINNDNIKL